MTSADLSPGHVLVFYTEGVKETENRIGEEFGMQRLSE
jgi:serine phosphatase RsbU (regulator of sigma subunit)